MRSASRIAISLAPFVSALWTVPAHAAVLKVNCDAGPYLRISDAVAAANDGDSIVVEVCSAAYVETVNVRQFDGLDIVAASEADVGARAAGVGASNLHPPVTVSGDGIGLYCFNIENSQNVLVQNFNIQNCQSGVSVSSSQNVMILANRIAQPANFGVSVSGDDNVQILGNLIVDAGSKGIAVEDADYTTLADNFVVRAHETGMRVIGTVGNVIRNNTVAMSGDRGLVAGDVDMRIERNTFSGSGGRDIFIADRGNNVHVIGNRVPNGIVDFGTGTQLVNNY